MNRRLTIMQRLAMHVLVALLVVVVVGKAVLSPGYGLIFAYGITVSLVLVVTFTYAMFVYRDPAVEGRAKLARLQAAGAPAPADPLVSVMVAVFNEEKFVERCILSVIGQDYKNVERIFVNDKSTDRTAQILDRFAKQGLITVIHLEKNLGKKGALGEAMRVAKGSIFAFTDSDSVWKRDALGRCVDVFKAYADVGAVSGHGRALNGGKNLVTRMQDSWYEGQFAVRKAFESVFGVVSCVSGPLAVFRREAVFNYVPAWQFDSFLGQEFRFATDRTLTGFVLGSREIGPSLKAKYADSWFVTSEDHAPRDWRVVYAKSARSQTIVPDTIGRMLKQQIRWKKSFIRNMFFTGSFMWRKPALPALFYYLHILFVLLGPVVAARHLVLMPMRGDLAGPVLYLCGIIFVGFMFGASFKIENPQSSRWVYRPFMSLFSTLVLSWLIFYSAVTIRKSVWSRS